MISYFFYGTLCHLPLLEVVLGHTPDVVEATLPGHSVFWVEDEAFPMILEGGVGASGLLAQNISDEDVARLSFYESGFGYFVRELHVDVLDRNQPVAQVFFPNPGLWRRGSPWRLEDWVTRWGDTVVATARDFMARYGDIAPDALRRRYGQMLVRGGATVRAAQERSGVATLRRQPAKDDIQRLDLRHPYTDFFSVEEHQLRIRRYDGSMSQIMQRSVFVSGDASVVLPYDPIRDRVLVIEQFRAGPFARGDANPWLLETVAGRIDGGESPEDAARREASEEAGISLGALIAGPSFYPSPAAKSEYIYSFVGIADLPDEVAGLGGLAQEAEDIRSHVISFDRLMQMVKSGEVDNAPLLVLSYWLEGKRQDLRNAALAEINKNPSMS